MLVLLMLPQLQFPDRAWSSVIQRRARGKLTRTQLVFLESLHISQQGQPGDQTNLCSGNNGKITPLKSLVTYVSPGDGALNS